MTALLSALKTGTYCRLKTCAKCKEEKPIGEFASGGKKVYCRPCYREKSRANYHRHKAKWREADPTPQRACTLCALVKPATAFHRSPSPGGLVSACKTCLQFRRRELKYGVRQLAGACEVCKRTEPEIKLVADHCHDSSLFRGTLCAQCNAALGLLGNDPNRIKRLRKYIEAWLLLSLH